jgi:hypothetical protein
MRPYIVVGHVARFAGRAILITSNARHTPRNERSGLPFSVPAVIAVFVATSAVASLAVPVNVAESMAGVGLEGASLRAVVVGLRAVAVVVGLRAVVVRLESAVDNADEGIRAIATALRFDANCAENQSARDENSGKRSFD